jgi:hypothetical protein
MRITKATKAVARGFKERATSLGMKGAKLDRAALEYTCGAWCAAQAISGPDTPDEKALGIMAYLVAIRGFGEMERYANIDDEPAASAADQPARQQ